MSNIFESLKTQPATLSDKVLLFSGLLPPRLARRETLPDTGELFEIFVEYWNGLRGRVWAWRRRESTERLILEADATTRLVEAGNELLTITRNDWNAQRRGLRIELNIPDKHDPLVKVPELNDPIALYAALLRGGAHSAYIRRRSEGELAWSWPLRIGLAGPGELLSGVDPQSSLQPLFQAFDYDRAPLRLNILLSEMSLLELSESIAQRRHRPQTDSVVLFGGLGYTDVPVWQLLSKISGSTGAQGVFVFDSLELDRAKEFARELIIHLSHDRPIDTTVAAISDYSGTSVLSWATRSLVEESSVKEQGRTVVRRLQEMTRASIRLSRDPLRAEPETPPAPPRPEPTGGGPKSFKPPVSPPHGPGDQFDIIRRPVSRKRVSAREFADDIERALEAVEDETGGGPPALVFDHESGGARRVAEIADAVTKETDLDAAEREDRHLQARVETPAGRTIKGRARMLPAHEYVASVFIGALNPTYLALETSFKSPTPESPVLLDVLFWEPQASPTPQLAQLTLPVHGDTGVAEFPFRTAAEQTTFSARIAIYHGNRNLQTGLLKGVVGQAPAELRFTLDAVPLTKFVGLSDRVGIDASIIVNDDDAGNMNAYVKSDGEVAVANVSDEKPPPHEVNVNPSKYQSLDEIKLVLGRAITRITTNPDDYGDLSKEGSRKLLLELAQHGSSLLTRLRKHSQMRELFDDVKYIQIVSAHFDAFFPIEYFYDGESPEDEATICDGPQSAQNALLSGQCCGAYDRSPDQVICPLRFWSLTKVIERHAHLPEHSALNDQFQLRNYPVSGRNRLLDPLRCAVLAASVKAGAADADTVKNLCTDVDGVLRTKAVPATDWKSWATNVEDVRPDLLILLPHHEQAEGFSLLEIGGDKLKSTQIKKKHVQSSKDPDGRPIVLLIGCQTNSAKVELENFVPAFQDAGAVIIVSTIATILGRHAGPAAAAIVQELKKQEGKADATFGDVMLEVRRRLLAAGVPMVLGLTSYGDADWRIGTGNTV